MLLIGIWLLVIATKNQTLIFGGVIVGVVIGVLFSSFKVQKN